MQKEQYEKFQNHKVTKCEYEKKFNFEPIPGKTSINGRDGFPTALQIMVPIELVIIPFDRFQPPTFTDTSLFDNFVKNINDIVVSGLRMKDLAILPSKECIIGTFEQQLKNVLVLGEEKNAATINLSVFGFRGPIRDYIIYIRYPTVIDSSGELTDSSNTLKYLVSTFKLLPERESDRIEENQKKEVDYKNFVDESVEDIFQTEYAIALMRIRGLNLDNLNDVTKIVQSFKPFAIFIDHFQIRKKGEIDVERFVKSYNKAETGSITEFKDLIREQLNQLETQTEADNADT